MAQKLFHVPYRPGGGPGGARGGPGGPGKGPGEAGEGWGIDFGEFRKFRSEAGPRPVRDPVRGLFRAKPWTIEGAGIPGRGTPRLTLAIVFPD